MTTTTTSDITMRPDAAEVIGNGCDSADISEVSTTAPAKLSKLQKSILRIALRNHLAGKDRVYYSEILSEHYGFEIKNRLDNCGQHFSRREIGAKRYSSAQAALSRAMRRLEDRGLIDCISGVAKWTAARLTLRGIETANKVANCHSNNRNVEAANKVPQWNCVNREKCEVMA